MQTLTKASQTGRGIFLALATCLSMTSACAGPEDAGEPQNVAVIAGNTPDPTNRPYEDLYVKVVNTTKGVYCSGTLIGGPTTASYVLTAGHCFSATTDSVYVTGRVIPKTNGIAVFRAPHYNGSGVDAALIQLENAVSVPGAVYFTNADAQQLIGTNVRCYGYGATVWDDAKQAYTGGGSLRWGDFTITDAGGSTMIYDLAVPNDQGQATAPGDSGGSCFHHGSSFDISAITITGICKAGSTKGIPTYADQTAAVSFSSWVRTFVPRP